MLFFIMSRVLKSGWVQFLTPFSSNRNCNQLLLTPNFHNRQPDHQQPVVIGPVATKTGCNQSQPKVNIVTFWPLKMPTKLNVFDFVTILATANTDKVECIQLCCPFGY